MDPLRLVIPKGRIGEGVRALLDEVGYGLAGAERSYRPRCDAEGVEVKLLKPQNIPQLLALGRHDLGFSGHDWVIEQGAEVIELLDLGLDPVRIVAAAPSRSRARSTRSGGRSSWRPSTCGSPSASSPSAASGASSCARTGRPRSSRPRTPT